MLSPPLMWNAIVASSKYTKSVVKGCSHSLLFFFTLQQVLMRKTEGKHAHANKVIPLTLAGFQESVFGFIAVKWVADCKLAVNIKATLINTPPNVTLEKSPSLSG